VWGGPVIFCGGRSPLASRPSTTPAEPTPTTGAGARPIRVTAFWEHGSYCGTCEKRQSRSAADRELPPNREKMANRQTPGACVWLGLPQIPLSAVCGVINRRPGPNRWQTDRGFPARGRFCSRRKDGELAASAQEAPLRLSGEDGCLVCDRQLELKGLCVGKMGESVWGRLFKMEQAEWKFRIPAENPGVRYSQAKSPNCCPFAYDCC
jgi:hypothetical protein